MDLNYEIKPCDESDPRHHHHHLHNNHHHHHRQLFFFPHRHHNHHHHCHCHCHRRVFPNFASLPQTLESFDSHAFPNDHTVESSEKGGPVESAPRVLQEQEEYGLEEEEDDEPIFVLTDEWRDFFAKSAAKRKLQKKQAKKGKK